MKRIAIGLSLLGATLARAQGPGRGNCEEIRACVCYDGTSSYRECPTYQDCAGACANHGGVAGGLGAAWGAPPFGARAPQGPLGPAVPGPGPAVPPAWPAPRQGGSR